MHDNMPICNSFNTVLGGVPITVMYTIYNDHGVRATFSYLGTSYQFVMAKWKSRKFTDFTLKFHEAHADMVKFGSSWTNNDGLPTISTTPEQQTAIVVQAIRDTFAYLDTLLRTQQKMILDYACWYREKHSTMLETYADYFQLVTCHCIVHSEFFAPSIPWVIVPFTQR